MKKIYFSSAIILLSICQLKAQENKHIEYMIKYDLISLLGDQVTTSLGIQFGTEVMYKRSRSLVVDAMYIFPCAGCDRPYTTITTESTYGWMISGAHRFYLSKPKISPSGFHLGPQVFYQHTKSEMRETYDGGIENYYHVYRDLVAAHVMAGYQLRIVGSLYFNPAVGLGTRFISSRNKNKKGTDSGQHEFPYDKDFESGSAWFPSFNINIKLGLKL